MVPLWYCVYFCVVAHSNPYSRDELLNIIQLTSGNFPTFFSHQKSFFTTFGWWNRSSLWDLEETQTWGASWRACEAQTAWPPHCVPSDLSHHSPLSAYQDGWAASSDQDQQLRCILCGSVLHGNLALWCYPGQRTTSSAHGPFQGAIREMKGQRNMLLFTWRVIYRFLVLNCKPFYSTMEFSSFLLICVYIPSQTNVSEAVQWLNIWLV